MRVTVVATGLGAPVAPKMVVDNGGRQSASESGVDYDRPTVMRRRAAAGAGQEAARDSEPQQDMDYLDIPAFLRRQAD